MKIYKYEPKTGEFIKEIENTEGVPLPANTTEIKPPDEKHGYVTVFDNDKWIQRYHISTIVDQHGAIVRTINEPVPLSDRDSIVGLVEGAPPLDGFYLWEDNKWVKKEKPEGMFFPIYKNGKWEEGLTNKQKRRRVDAETTYLIKTWCIEQGKCEEYYLNRGIDDKQDSEYLEYKAQRETIINNQNTKK